MEMTLRTVRTKDDILEEIAELATLSSEVWDYGDQTEIMKKYAELRDEYLAAVRAC